MEAEVTSFKDLVVWQRAFNLCTELYRDTRGLPRDERFGLVAEIRKTARSVVYNIAEGHRRRSTREFIRFLDISAGSAGELETQLLLVGHLGYLEKDRVTRILCDVDEIERMLTGLVHSLRRRLSLPHP